jgi:hypothetical protein
MLHWPNHSSLPANTSLELVFFVATAFSLQLGRSQDKIHASILDVP